MAKPAQPHLHPAQLTKTQGVKVALLSASSRSAGLKLTMLVGLQAHSAKFQLEVYYSVKKTDGSWDLIRMVEIET